MSVSTRNQAVPSGNGLRWRMAQASRPVGSLAGKTVPLAQQAVPLARSAGTTVRLGTETALARATPAVEAARSWAAPQLENSAHAISDTIAPRISDALIIAAHKIEVPKRKSRSRGGVVASVIALTAAAGAAAVAVVRLRRQSNGTAGADGADLGSVSATEAGADAGTGPDSGPDADMNGQSRIV